MDSLRFLKLYTYLLFKQDKLDCRSSFFLLPVPQPLALAAALLPLADHRLVMRLVSKTGLHSLTCLVYFMVPLPLSAFSRCFDRTQLSLFSFWLS